MSLQKKSTIIGRLRQVRYAIIFYRFLQIFFKYRLILGTKQSVLVDAFNKQTKKVSDSITNSLISMGSVTKSEKYKIGSTMQADRYLRLLTMIIKCMLPISIVIFIHNNSVFF